MQIAGDFVKSRKRRFFILDHHFIRYYESENAVAQELAKGTIELEHVYKFSLQWLTTK